MPKKTINWRFVADFPTVEAAREYIATQHVRRSRLENRLHCRKQTFICQNQQLYKCQFTLQLEIPFEMLDSTDQKRGSSGKSIKFDSNSEMAESAVRGSKSETRSGSDPKSTTPDSNGSSVFGSDCETAPMCTLYAAYEHKHALSSLGMDPGAKEIIQGAMAEGSRTKEIKRLLEKAGFQIGDRQLYNHIAYVRKKK